ncbi:C40 family peptidase [Nitrosomonas mobilis]|uniref:NLP/P60 n=1 Tax=Nitrosomonas mobilis TaxID=51642 RepID=A0A1G5SGF5_9PROT|nr:NlpC/P60 family protein [Nitrosomonas mobilis]SCZ85950.1 NLP/P60 [Nitrosomonas mobilis]
MKQTNNIVFRYFLVVLLSISTVTGCGTFTSKLSQRPPSLLNRETDADTKAILDRLYTHYQQWQGTPYRLGGESRSGIDCSALVRTVYQSAFGVDLPRLTGVQAQLGNEIGRHELKAGDLVFFKTGKRTQHVGIYLEDRKFLHASTSVGVTISRMDNTYWRNKYWKSVRI